MAVAKEEALRLIERMPGESTWDDIMYELYVKKKIARGLQAASEGKTTPHDELKARLQAQ